jgi:hypothetical protein
MERKKLMKKDTKSWAIKLRGRSFYKMSIGGAVTLNTKQEAIIFADSITRTTGVMAEAIRVRVRIEEIK